jgi:CMP-N,N'-diacetyllegionaminic acid synthase
MKVVALLTGRGNNSLPDKNVLNVLGKPVLYYPAIAARNAKLVTSLYCSSDDEKILREAEKYGHLPIVRPEEYAKPTSQHAECIFHGLKVIEQREGLPDILVVTLANNVTIKPDWIDACVQMMIDDMELTAVVPVYEDMDHHPLRAKTLDESGFLVMYEKGITDCVSTNRQDLPICYFLAHNFWVLNVQKMLANDGKGQPPWNFMGNVIKPFIIEESIDIHDARDLIMAGEWVHDNLK